MSEIKVNSIKGVAASAAAISVDNSNGTCTLASGSKLNNCTTDGTTNLTIADGNLVIGTAGHGINFSATSDTTTAGATMDNELFNDYEEGNFVPQIGLGGSVSSYTIARGSYTRIGDVCFFQIDLLVVGTADGNNLRISALPFNSQNQATQAFGGAFLNYSAAAFSSIGDRVLFHIISQDNKIQVYNAVTGNAVAGTSTGVDLFNNREIVLQGFYKCT